MKLSTAKLLASYNENQLHQLAKSTGYNDVFIEEIIEVDIREKDVRYKVRFEDDGSFGDEEPIGNVFVEQLEDLSVRLEF